VKGMSTSEKGIIEVVSEEEQIPGQWFLEELTDGERAVTPTNCTQEDVLPEAPVEKRSELKVYSGKGTTNLNKCVYINSLRNILCTILQGQFQKREM
jgi:hypothetical protein